MTRTSLRPCLRVRPGFGLAATIIHLPCHALKNLSRTVSRSRLARFAADSNGGDWRLPRVVVAKSQRRASIRVGSSGRAEHPMRMRLRRSRGSRVKRRTHLFIGEECPHQPGATVASPVPLSSSSAYEYLLFRKRSVGSPTRLPFPSDSTYIPCAARNDLFLSSGPDFGTSRPVRRWIGG